MNLSNIIVNYNNSDVLIDCIESINKTIDGINFETIVIDNSANDDGIGTIKEKFPKVKFIQNKSNVGFARANNQAVKISKGDVLFFLNPDIVLTEGAFNKMISYLNSYQKIGVLGPKILNMDGTLQYSCRSFPGVWTGLFNRYSLISKFFPNNPYTARYLLTDFDHNEIKEVDWLSGSCLMIPRKVFLRVGMFDENYFLFNEDVDLCKSLKKYGYKVLYYPYAKVNHRITSSNRKVDSVIIVKRHLGMSYYFKKHHKVNIILRCFVNLFISLRCFSQLILFSVGF